MSIRSWKLLCNRREEERLNSITLIIHEIEKYWFSSKRFPLKLLLSMKRGGKKSFLHHPLSLARIRHTVEQSVSMSRYLIARFHFQWIWFERWQKVTEKSVMRDVCLLSATFCKNSILYFSLPSHFSYNKKKKRFIFISIQIKNQCLSKIIFLLHCFIAFAYARTSYHKNARVINFLRGNWS